MNDTLTNLQNTSFNDLILSLDALHFIRSDWFYTFIPLIIYLLLSNNKVLGTKKWRSTIDAQLLPFVLTKRGGKKRSYPLLLIFIAGSLCITALAGPVYKKLPQPVYREQSSLVVLLDLSQSMNAADIKPSRLSRSKLELIDILKSRKSGQTALIVYAADAFVVTPLTDDNATIANLIPALETNMMPAQGSNLSNALYKAFTLFTQAGIVKGDILVITDSIHSRDQDTIEKVSSKGHRLSVFGIGTTDGAPIPLDESHGGGFLQNNGAIIVPKLKPTELQRYALMGSGLYTSLQANDDDIEKLANLFQSNEIEETDGTQNNNADIWQEEGHWLLLPLLFFVALWSRKGWLASLLPFSLVIFISTPKPAYAELIDTNHLWTSPDQKAMQLFNAGDNENAAETFTQKEWKASAHYRKGDFDSAAQLLDGIKHSDAYYNKANALAKQGKYPEAIQSYDQAIELDEKNDDAIYNREKVKEALEKQQEQSQQDNSEQDSSKQEKSEQEQSEQEQQSEDSQSQESNESNEESSDNKQSEQQNAEQQKIEEKQLEQRDAKKEHEEAQKEQEQYEQNQTPSKENNEIENKEPEYTDEQPMEIESNPMEASISEEEKATEQWLKRIPDDPGGLLRRKFLYQYNQIPNQKNDNEPW